MRMLILQHKLGHYCGYVGVPKSHPFYKRGCDSLQNIIVHGGLTFSGFFPACDTDTWWLGFDCAHAGDFVPSLGMDGAVRDLDFVVQELKKLSAQIPFSRE